MQRCMDDKTMLEATYEGEHSHGALVNVDLALSGTSLERKRTRQSFSDILIHKKEKSIEEHVQSLMKDPEFTSALAGAVAQSLIPLPRPSSD